MRNLFARFVREDAGQDLAAYALLIGLITLTCIVYMKGLWL